MKATLAGVLTLAALVAQTPVAKKKRGPGPKLDAVKQCQALKVAGERAEATGCFLRLGNASDPYDRAEGQWGVADFSSAMKSFEEALKKYPDDPTVRIRFGELFYERFNRNEALKLLTEALEIEPTNAQGMLSLATMLSRGFDSKAMELAAKAAEADPGLYQAHELLARLLLENSEEDKAIEAARSALKANPKALNARATLGVIELLKNKPTDQFDQILAINPRYGEGWFWAGHHFVQNRRYDEGIEYFQKALAVDPDLLVAREQLGVNLMRTGKSIAAMEQLELAYKAGRQSDEVVNSLRLIDSYKNFVSYKFEGGELRLAKKEAEILRPYFEEEVKRARVTYEAKYKMKLEAPLEVEVYPNHEDFAVRTLGMPGLGATGVSFGPVVAMDSPSARRPGDYHWASTLWHELSHSYILVKSKYLVPRWFTEGISVHEETQASAEWGDNVEPPMLEALKEKKFLPVEDFDSGFVRPKNPMQVGLSYFQAGQALDWIVRDYGQAAVNGMVDDFAKQTPLVDVLRRNLKLTPKEFDAKLDAYLNERWGKSAANLKDWKDAMRRADGAMKQKDYDAVITATKRARELFPEHVASYEALGKAYTEKAQKPEALEALREYAKRGGRAPWALKELAKLEEGAGDRKLAAAALQRVIYIAPVGDEDLHKKLGEYYLELKQPERALPAFQAQLASKPVDPAGTYYNLARSYLALSRRPEAQEALFEALELAPGFKPAQKLLLEMESNSAKKD